MKQPMLRALLPGFLLILFFSCRKNDLKEPTPPPVEGNNIFTVRYYGQDIKVVKKGDDYFWFDDVAFDQKTFDSLKALKDKGPSTLPRSVFTTEITNYWPSGNVYYSISSAFTPYSSERKRITAAIAHWASKTSLKFVQRTNQSNYIGFERVVNQDYAGASEGIGMKGGYQYLRLNVSAKDTFSTGTVIHEIGHAIGLYHEQCRVDRDNAIQINWSNMKSDVLTQNQFKTYAQLSKPGSELGPFDFNSIMLYGSYLGSKYDPLVDYAQWSSHPVMTRLDQTTFVGQRSGLSVGDVAGIGSLYGPPFAKFTYTTTTIVDDGFNYEFRYFYYLTFYADQQLTQPVNLLMPKSIRLQVDNSGFIADQGSWANRTYTIVNLASGQNTYLVGEGYNQGYDDPWSTSRNWNETSTLYPVGNGCIRP